MSRLLCRKGTTFRCWRCDSALAIVRKDFFEDDLVVTEEPFELFEVDQGQGPWTAKDRMDCRLCGTRWWNGFNFQVKMQNPLQRSEHGKQEAVQNPT